MNFRKATPSDAPLVAGVLEAAAARLRERGQALWTPAEVSTQSVAPHVEKGMYHLGWDEAGVVGVFRFQLEDRWFWPEIPAGTSAFIHKLAVCPTRQGHGHAQLLLSHACALTRQLGRRYLRLDCADGRPGLRAVYERFGFRHHSDRILAAGVFHRFELDLGPATD